MALSKVEIGRYSRQLLVPDLGVAGQERLRRSSALIIGAGGLGSPAALYLAAAGVGRLGVVDPEAVALSNLHRQVLHATADIGHPKVASASRRLSALNPEIEIVTRRERLTPENALALIQGHDVVLDGSDNFTTRYVVNDACVLAGTPLVYGGVVHVQGQVLTIRPGVSACFRCVFPEPPAMGAVPSCQDAGILGTVAGVIGVLMAHEALKLLGGFGTPLTDRLLVFEGRASRMRDVPVRRDPACAVCGTQPTIRTLVSEAPACEARAA